MVATRVESSTNSPASEQIMDVLMDVKALAAGSTTAATAVEAKQTPTADAENETTTATPAVEAPEPEGATVHNIITTNEDVAANANVEDNGMTDDSKPSAEATIASETERVQPPKSPDMEADDVSAEAASTTETESPSSTSSDTMIPLARKRTISACEPLQEDEPPTKNSKESPL